MNNSEIENILALEIQAPGLIEAVNQAGNVTSDFGNTLENIIDTLILNAKQRRELEAYLAKQRAEISIATVNAAQRGISSATWASFASILGVGLGLLAFFKRAK